MADYTIRFRAIGRASRSRGLRRGGWGPGGRSRRDGRMRRDRLERVIRMDIFLIILDFPHLFSYQNTCFSAVFINFEYVEPFFRQFQYFPAFF